MNKSARSASGVMLILLLTVGAIATAAVVFWYYQLQAREVRNLTWQQLQAIADGKVNQIANWRAERLGDGRVLESAVIIDMASRVLASGKAGSLERDGLRQILAGFLDAFQYADAEVIDNSGSIAIALRGTAHSPERLRSAAEATAARGGPVLLDLAIDPATHRPMMLLALPVRKLGAIVLDIDPSISLYPYLRMSYSARPGAEALLVRRNGPDDAEYVSLVVPGPHGPEFFHRPVKAVGMPPEQALVDGWLFRSLDYRGVPSLGVIRKIPNSPWYLGVKLNENEVEAPVSKLGREVAAVIVLILIVNIASAGLIWRSQQVRHLKEREAWLHKVADETPAYLWMSSPDGRISFINAPFAHFFGVDNVQAFTRTWTQFVHPDDSPRVEELFATSMANRQAFVDEHRIRRSDGEYRWVLSRARPMFNPTGGYTGHSGSVIDITERKAAEEEVHALPSRLIRATEQERSRLARELHDDASQQIAALSISTGNLKRKLPHGSDELRLQFEKLQQRLLHLASTVRHISHQLHPAVLEHSGLAAALRIYFEELSEIVGLPIKFIVENEREDFPFEISLALYRIAQEALQNVVKHAQARQVWVELTTSPWAIRMTVRDDGVGISPAKSHGGAGLGVISMNERARVVHGTVTIEPDPAGGTRVSVEVPKPEEHS